MGRAKQSAINILASSGGFFLPLVVTFFTIPLLIKLLGEEGYGLQSLAAVISGYLAFMDMGLDVPMIKLLAEDNALKNYGSANKLLNTSFWFYSAVGILGAVILVMCSGIFVNQFFRISDHLKKDRAKKILEYIFQKNPNIEIRYEFDSMHLDKDIIDFLAKLPNNEFNFGIQTVNPAALKTVGRVFHQDKFERNYDYLVNKIGHRSITADLIYGLPGDTYEGFKQSMDYALQFDGIKWILTNPLILLPGSAFYREQKEYGIQWNKDSYMVTGTNTFSKRDMRLSIKLSFLTSMVFLKNIGPNSVNI